MTQGARSAESQAGTIFLDYDGTLHDSMAVYGPAFRHAWDWLVEGGWEQPREFSDRWISQWLGFTIRDMWTSCAPELPEPIWHEAAAIVARKMDALTMAGRARLFDGVPDALSELEARGFQLVFLSNCRNDYCDIHRKTFNLDAYFDAYYTAQAFDDIPKWRIYQQVAASHPYPHLMVGDRFSDIEVATHAHIPSIGCLYGFGTSDELKDATCCVAAPHELPRAIQACLARSAACPSTFAE